MCGQLLTGVGCARRDGVRVQGREGRRTSRWFKPPCARNLGLRLDSSARWTANAFDSRLQSGFYRKSALGFPGTKRTVKNGPRVDLQRPVKVQHSPLYILQPRSYIVRLVNEAGRWRDVCWRNPFVPPRRSAISPSTVLSRRLRAAAWGTLWQTNLFYCHEALHLKAKLQKASYH